jgi:hypothetical protein
MNSEHFSFCISESPRPLRREGQGEGSPGRRTLNLEEVSEVSPRLFAERAERRELRWVDATNDLQLRRCCGRAVRGTEDSFRSSSTTKRASLGATSSRLERLLPPTQGSSRRYAFSGNNLGLTCGTSLRLEPFLPPTAICDLRGRRGETRMISEVMVPKGQSKIGLVQYFFYFPTLKRWAIARSPSGTSCESQVS